MSVMAQAAHLQLRLGELFCPSCATDINRHLKRLPGVQAVHIDLHSHRVDVDYDPRRLDVEDILVTVGGASVTASVISEDR